MAEASEGHKTYRTMNNINVMLSKWKRRLKTTHNSFDYKVALDECIHELEQAENK